MDDQGVTDYLVPWLRFSISMRLRISISMRFSIRMRMRMARIRQPRSKPKTSEQNMMFF